MAEICPVCGEEITSENREVYKSINDPEGLVLHDYCLTKYVSKPEKYSGTAEEAEEEQAKQAEANFNKIIEQLDEVSLQEIKDKSVYVKDLDIPIKSMVIFMVKWAIASIPAFIILAIIGVICFAIFGALFF